MKDFLEELEAIVEDMRRDRVDAERYRALRARGWFWIKTGDDTMMETRRYTPGDFDAEADRARGRP